MSDEGRVEQNKSKTKTKTKWEQQSPFDGDSSTEGDSILAKRLFGNAAAPTRRQKPPGETDTDDTSMSKGGRFKLPERSRASPVPPKGSLLSSDISQETIDKADESNFGEDESTFSNLSNATSKNGTGISIDTNIARLARKEPRHIKRSPVSPRSTRKRAIIRRANTRLIPVHPTSSQSSNSAITETSDGYTPKPKADLKTVEISGELEEINAQFQETLNEFSKRYQDSTVALQEKSHLMKRNQELLHTLAAKEEEMEYLKNELWSAGNKLQDYESDMKQMIEQHMEPLVFTHEDLTRIEREIEDQEVLIRGYKLENEKIMNQLKEIKEQSSAAAKDNEKLNLKNKELTHEVEHLREMVCDKDDKDSVSEVVLQQMDEMKQEIKRLKEKEATLEQKEVALKTMDEMKKELSELRDRESNYMIKIDDMENQLSGAHDENEQITRSKTETMERMTEEMNIMKYTYESQIENLHKEAITKDGRDLRFKKLQTAIEKIEDAAGRNVDVTQVCAELRRNKLLPPRRKRKSADISKDPHSNKDPASPASTKKQLKRSPSQTSLGGRSRASTLSSRASPTPSAISSVSTRDDFLDLEAELDNEQYNLEVTDLKGKIKKLEDEKRDSDASKEKLEDDIKLLQEVKERLEDEFQTLKREQAERKDEYDKKIRELEEILLEVSAEPVSNDADTSANNNEAPAPDQVKIPPNIMQELDVKQGIIEELVEKLKRKEESLEYYQNAYLEKSEELDALIEHGESAEPSQSGNGAVNVGAGNASEGNNVVNVGDRDKKISNKTTGIVGSSTFNYLMNEDLSDLASLPITSDLLAAGFFESLGDMNVIERLIAQLERTIVERTMQLDAAHQRANEAEAKLLSQSREKMSWGFGYDSQVKSLKNQVQKLQELLQLERKATRKAAASAVAAKQQSTPQPNGIQSSDQSLAGDPKDPSPPKNSSHTEAIAETKELRAQIELLTTENISLKAQLETSETVRQAVHENTLNILQQKNKASTNVDENSESLRELIMEKEAEVSALKGRYVGLEHLVERQRELLAFIVPSALADGAHLPNNDSTTKGGIKNIVLDDSIDEKVLQGLSDTAKEFVQHLREENILLRRAIAVYNQKEEKQKDAPQQGTLSGPQNNCSKLQSSAEMIQQLETLASQISVMETRFIKREKELQDVIIETKRQGELQLERWKEKWGATIEKKNEQIRRFRGELETMMNCVGKLDGGWEVESNDASIHN